MVMQVVRLSSAVPVSYVNTTAWPYFFCPLKTFDDKESSVFAVNHWHGITPLENKQSLRKK